MEELCREEPVFDAVQIRSVFATGKGIYKKTSFVECFTSIWISVHSVLLTLTTVQ